MATPLSSSSSSSSVDLTDHLPLQLLKSETIPPSPNHSNSIDWLPDFAGYSWVAYGASSLLVISHFPSPLSPHQSHIGPIFRQVFQLLPSYDVVSVVWSPVMPSSGDLAVASHNRIFLYHYDSSPGSFCWSQTTLLVQSIEVEVIAWTGSGDGIISGGSEVILWKRSGESWEIAWKFRTKVPQTLVSTTWSLEGPSASGVCANKINAKELATVPCNSNDHVSVFQYDGKCGYVATELRHPQPVLAMQWRPCGERQLNRDVLYAPRNVLLTSCLDGVVRLWCEIDGSKMRKGNKDNREMSTSRRFFCVVAVIEINQSFGGILGKDIFLQWALDMEGIICVRDGVNVVFKAGRSQTDEVGSCEWLIGAGPGRMLTFWAVHCLDDISTMRSPRVTLWKSQEVMKPDLGSSSKNNGLRNSEGSYFNKVVVWRNRRFGPPSVCSLIQLFPCNNLIWSVLYAQSLQKEYGESSNLCETDSKLSCQSRGVLDTLGHTGKVLQVAVHPSLHEVKLAVSLDSNGLLIFWSIFTSSNSFSGLPSLTPSWQLRGKFILQNTVAQDMSLCWAPSWLEEEQILLIGYAQGIDCFIIKTCVTEENKILCHKFCTIPFNKRDHFYGPDQVVSLPLPSCCKKDSNFNYYLLLGIWMKNFQAESWKVTLHSYELSESEHSYESDTGSNGEYGVFKSKTDFAGKTYCMVASPCSTYIPDGLDEVTSFSVVSPRLSMYSLQPKLVNDFCPSNFPYHMATGHSDGRSRIWRINLSDLSVGSTLFELVGIFSSLQCPITAISIADWGQMIATVCSDDINNVNMLYIWEPLHLAGAGTLVLEDKISLSGKVVAFNWFLMDNILFLGVCFQNELHIYSQRIRGAQTSLYLDKMQKESIWVCIGVVHTSSTICDFALGPRCTLIVIHEKYFTLYSHWSLLTSDKHLTDGQLSADDAFDFKSQMDRNIPALSASKIQIFEELSVERSSEDITIGSPLTKAHGDKIGTKPLIASPKKNHFSKMTVLAEILRGPLPVYHPEALLNNIYSGNWARAYAAVCHLVQCLTPNTTANQSETPPISSLKLSKYFEGKLSNGEASRGVQWSNDLDTSTWSPPSEGGKMQFVESANNAINRMPTATAVSFGSYEFDEFLGKAQVRQAVTNAQKMQMFAIVDLLYEISNIESTSAYESLDDPGKRFWCAIRLQQLEFRKRYSRAPSIAELAVNSRLFVWAFHSDCQAILFSTILPAEPAWEDMRKLGVGFWFTNMTDLRSKMEKLARCQYLKNKDPKACALLYIALNRLQVLAGLFKISKNEKDKPLVAFLSRNFQEEKHRAAASKNAYVLMGKHQYELAIAFFLLGGDIISAITVCAKTLGDEQLAVVICRLIEGEGGASERHLISNILLPAAIEKGDYWLASVLEWKLSSCLQSFLIVLGLQRDSYANESEINHAAFFDPSIGQYCQMLGAKNSLRNAVGELNAAVLCRWTTMMTASAFNKCGLPLEALESLSSSVSIAGVLDKKQNGEDSEVLPRILRPSLANSSRWLADEVACHLVSHVKLDLAMQYAVKLIKEHQCGLKTNVVLSRAGATATSWNSLEHEISQYGALLKNFKQELDSELAYLETKFSVVRDILLDKIFISLDNDGLLLKSYHGSVSEVHPPASRNSDFTSFQLHHFENVTAYLSYSLPRFVVACIIARGWALASSELKWPVFKPYWGFQSLEFYIPGFESSVLSLRTALMALSDDNSRDLVGQCFFALDLCKYCVYFALAMLQHNLKALDAMLQPVLVLCADGNYGEIDIISLREINVVEAFSLKSSEINDLLGTQELLQENEGDMVFMTPEDEKWLIFRLCLWQHLSKLIKYQLNHLSSKLSCDATETSAVRSSVFPTPEGKCSMNNVRQVLMNFIKTIGNTFTHVTSHTARQLAIFLWQKVEDGTSMPIVTWLEEFSQSTLSVFNDHQDQSCGTSEILDKETGFSCSKLLAKISHHPKLISEMLVQSPVKLSEVVHYKIVKGWNHLHMCVLAEHEKLESYKQEGIFDNSPRGNKGKIHVGSEQNHNLLGPDFDGAALTKKVVRFNNPKEIYRRSGELFEAFCINPIEQQQAALASNKKGISFFSWGDGLPSTDLSDYIWQQSDWPQNGWAGTESTPVPTCVSPGVGLGSDKGSQLGLGGTTVGVGFQSKIGKDLTGGRAFGIPGYAGIGSTGLSWGIQDEFDKCVDPPATLNNVNGSALAAHPSRPFFLVGSSNTHIYLWEFGKEKAVATYGVLPAANIPPPYALASVTGLQFDRCGHRFASSASDGTVSAWQLEVGGRSNVKPTESSLCFSGHVSDVCYVATSGSIIAAAGYSSTGVNVVIWDTLAPPSSSRASVMCHEGGASSIAVFDNDMGTGSISPLIVTGGKSGDVGLHDFRYIATGKTKRHRHLNTVDRVMDTAAIDIRSELSSSVGDQNRHGMLWYIPKAHSGSVTKIATIPNTSFFLTGSKDGDVKLWDAKKASLVFHWPKLHERHTFLNRSSQGFGGVTRVGLTDIQVISDGFLTCGGDGTVKLVQLNNFPS